MKLKFIMLFLTSHYDLQKQINVDFFINSKVLLRIDKIMKFNTTSSVIQNSKAEVATRER
jgi:hypothetical protein